jgi:hypothetical protein
VLMCALAIALTPLLPSRPPVMMTVVFSVYPPEPGLSTVMFVTILPLDGNAVHPVPHVLVSGLLNTYGRLVLPVAL